MNSSYNAADIEVLSGLDPVKRRPGMYTDTTRPNHLAQEVTGSEALALDGDDLSLLHAQLLECPLAQPRNPFPRILRLGPRDLQPHHPLLALWHQIPSGWSAPAEKAIFVRIAPTGPPALFHRVFHVGDAGQ